MPSEGTICRESTVIHAEELFGHFSDLSDSGNTKDSFENCWEWPKEIGNGSISNIMLRPGILLEIGNFRLRENVAISFKQTHHSVALVFGISGSMKRALDPDKGQHEYWNCRQGQSVMGYLPKHQQSVIEPSAGSQAYFVTIALDPLLLKTLIDEHHDQMPTCLLDIVNGDEAQYFHRTSMMPPAVNAAIHQIISCPYRASLKRLFLEGKVLELISYSMAQLASSADPLQKKAGLQPDDMERVLEARNILVRNLENPPSLSELARRVGTNKTTLNKGFRQIFGNSVFEYLRIRRLEKAKELLDSREMNVGEAASRVGYTHQSSFARAFKNHFGTIPTGHLH
jgi:AraC-like DNA-binding protein